MWQKTLCILCPFKCCVPVSLTSGELSCDLWMPCTLHWNSLSKNDAFSSLSSVCSSVVGSPGFCNWDVSWGTAAWLWMWLLLMVWVSSPPPCFFSNAFHPLSYHSTLFPLNLPPSLWIFAWRWCYLCKLLPFNINSFPSVHKCSASKQRSSSWPVQQAGEFKCSSVGSVLNMLVTSSAVFEIVCTDVHFFLLITCGMLYWRVIWKVNLAMEGTKICGLTVNTWLVNSLSFGKLCKL